MVYLGNSYKDHTSIVDKVSEAYIVAVVSSVTACCFAGSIPALHRLQLHLYTIWPSSAAPHNEALVPCPPLTGHYCPRL
jgi:hypothetical protein